MSTIHVPSKLEEVFEGTRVPSILAKQFRLVPIFLLLLPPRFSVQLLSFRGMRTRDALLQIQMGTYANGATCYYTFPYTNNVLIGPAPWLCAAYELDPPMHREHRLSGYAPWKPIYRSFRVHFFFFFFFFFFFLLARGSMYVATVNWNTHRPRFPSPTDFDRSNNDSNCSLRYSWWFLFSSLLKQERSNIEMMGRWNVNRVLENLLRWCIKERYESIRLAGLWTFLLFVASFLLITSAVILFRWFQTCLRNMKHRILQCSHRNVLHLEIFISQTLSLLLIFT